MSDRVHILTVVLEPRAGLANDVADIVRELDGVVSVTPQLVRDSQVEAIIAGGGDRYIEVLGIDNMNARAAEGYRVVAGWSYGAGAIALMERQ